MKLDQTLSTSKGGIDRAATQPLAGVYVAGAFVVLAFLVRLPAVVLPALDWDAGFYLAVAAEMNAGSLLYVDIWDHKPAGIFLLFALIERIFDDAVLGARLLACLLAAFAAYWLFRIAVLLFRDGRPIGLASGGIYILFSAENTGLAANTEPFFLPLTILGLWLTARATFDPAVASRGGSRLLDLTGGLVLGVALQIKYVVLFDLVAFAIGYALLTAGSLASGRVWLRQSAIKLGLIAAGVAAPSLAAALWYLAAGEFDAFYDANVAAHLGRFEGGFGGLIVPVFALINYAPLLLATGLGLVFARRATKDEHERRALVMLAIWLAMVLLGIASLRYWYEHYFIQALPPLSLLTGFAVTRLVWEPISTWSGRLCVLFLLATSAFLLANRQNFLAMGDTVLQGHSAGDWAVADTARLVARDLALELEGRAPIFVFDHDPVIYYLAGAAVPTRFAHPGLWYKGAWGRFDPSAELERVLDAEPRFIVTRLDTLEEIEAASPASGEPESGNAYKEVKRQLLTALRQAYVLDRTYPRANVWGGQVVGIKSWGAAVYRRRAGSEGPDA